MRCIDWCGRIGIAGLGLLAGCTAPPGTPPSGSTSSTAAPRAGTSSTSHEPPPGPRGAPHAPATGATGASAGPPRLPLPRNGRNWNDVRRQAAERIVAANPDGTYTGTVPEALLAIPVLEIELNADGSVHRIEVLRAPRQAKDTIEIAAAAIRRAAPFGNVSRLPRPWKFVETFLFDDDRRFKPRTLEP